MSKENLPQNVDQFIGCGCYQGLLFLLMQFIIFVNAFNLSMMTFGKIEPKWTCLDWPLDPNSTNLTPKAMCKMWNETNCPNVTFSHDFYSVAAEFQLYCKSMSVIFLSMSVQMIGVLVASPLFGQLSDWYGRKWILLWCNALQIIIGTASAWSPNMPVFIAFRFVIGIFGGGSLTISFVYFVEFLTAKHRFWVNSATSWSIPFAFMAIFAWLTKDWRTFTIIGNLIGVPGVILLFFLAESPRWLLRKGKTLRAERSFNAVSKINRNKANQTTSTVLALIETGEKEKTKNTTRKVYSFWHLFSSALLAKRTVVLCFCFFSLSTISYGIMFDSSSLAGSPYLNFLIFALVRYFASLVGICADTLIKPCGRKVIFNFGFSVMFCCCVTIAIFKNQEKYNPVAVQVLTILAAVVTGPVWNAVYIQSSELFPTPLRNVGVGFCAVFNRLGLVICPQLLNLVINFSPNFSMSLQFTKAYSWSPAPYVIFSILAGATCILNFVLIPETKGKDFMENMPSKISSGNKRRDKNNRSSMIRNDSFTMYQFADQRNKGSENEALKTVP